MKISLLTCNSKSNKMRYWRTKVILLKEKEKILISVGIAVFLLFFVEINRAWSGMEQEWKQTFPKLAGMNIGAKNYDEKYYQQDLAKLDLIILGFYREWHANQGNEPIRQVIKDIKLQNPDIKVGQYTVLNEAYDDPDNLPNLDKYNVLYANNWWLTTADGQQVQWTSAYNSWEVNITGWTSTDNDGNRYPEWLAQRDYSTFFGFIPEFDIWYFDNVMWRPRIHYADWDLDGKNDSRDEERIQTAYRKGHLREWETARKLAPNLTFIGNADNDLNFLEYKAKLQGVFLEALMGKSWSMESWLGWEVMMERYHNEFVNTAPPHIIIFNVWGDENNYRFFRYAFTSSLLDDGYFSFTSNDQGYSSVAWFDEYNIDLGNALDPPAQFPWKDGVYMREFDNGIVLVNPTSLIKHIYLGNGFKHFLGNQDRITNNGEPAARLTLQPKDGIILIRDSKRRYRNLTTTPKRGEIKGDPIRVN